jgi:hypothetical protein
MRPGVTHKLLNCSEHPQKVTSAHDVFHQAEMMKQLQTAWFGDSRPKIHY